MHVTWIISNNSSAPYFNWFAEKASEKNEIHFSAICMNNEKPEMIRDLEKFGFTCYWIKYDYHKRKRGLLKSVIQLYKIFKKIKPDIIHSHLFDDSLAAMIAGKLSGIKKRVITKGDSGFHYYYTPQWVKFDKLNNRLATSIIAISGENKDFLIEKEHASPHKIKLIHHGLPVSRTTLQFQEVKDEFRQRWNLNNKVVIGTLSRFIEWKGYRHIVMAVELLAPTHPELVFVFTGRGAQKKEIEELVKAKKLHRRIIFTNWIEPEKIPSLFGIMDIYLHAANTEPFGLVIAEAMLNGVPVVSTKTGAAADAITHQKNGFLCNVESPLELADGIKYVLKNNISNCIGNAGKQSAEKLFTIEQMYSAHISLYKQLL